MPLLIQAGPCPHKIIFMDVVPIKGMRVSENQVLRTYFYPNYLPEDLTTYKQFCGWPCARAGMKSGLSEQGRDVGKEHRGNPGFDLL
jgi:hypothetical protein